MKQVNMEKAVKQARAALDSVMTEVKGSTKGEEGDYTRRIRENATPNMDKASEATAVS